MSIGISVVITAYNFRPFLRAAVLSLLAQNTQRAFEVIVIDDASPDRSFEVLADLLDPRLRVIVSAHNAGAAGAINRGMAMATGRYIARFDGDDVWLPDALESLADALDRHPNATVAYGDIRTIDSEGALGSHGIERPAGPLERDEFDLLLARHYTCAPAMLSRRDAWNAVLPWPERFRSGLGDWYFNLKLARLGSFVHVARVLAHYRVHPQGMHHSFIRDRTGEANLRAIFEELAPRTAAGRLTTTSRRLLARHLANIANAYFLFGMGDDARRLYGEVLGMSPGALANRTTALPAIGTLTLGAHRYAALKARLRGHPASPH